MLEVNEKPVVNASIPAPKERFRWWVILLGVVLIPVNSLWIARTEAMDYSGFPTCASLFFNVIFSLLVLMLLNSIIRRFLPRFAFCRRELIVLYAMIATGSSLVGHDTMQMVVPTIPHAKFFASPENRWNELIVPRLPNWMTIKTVDDNMRGYEYGHSTLYKWEYIKPWILPITSWTFFLVSTIMCMLSINILLRRHWVEHERLSYPVVQIPLLITEGGGSNPLFRSNLFWVGFGIAAGLDLLNGFAQFYPALPTVNMKMTDISYVFSNSPRPWNAMGWLVMSFYPFVIGLSFFMPTNMAFSCWFFFIFRKMQQIGSAAIGSEGLDPNFPYFREQAFGALIALFAASLWYGRGHLKQVWRAVFCGEGQTDDGGVSYRFALTLLISGAVVFFAFLVAFGISPIIAFIYVILYLMFCGALTRIRAELGPPAHEIGGVGPTHIMVATLGTAILGPQNLALFGLLWFQNRMHRGILMPQQAESLKAASESGLKTKTMVFALALAGVVGVISAFWALMHLSYGRHYGTMHPGAPGSGFASEAYNTSAYWLNSTIEPGIGSAFGLLAGAVIAILLARFSVMFYGFPFHPAGYAIGMAFGTDYIWLPIMISWFLKVIILRYWGRKGYQTTIPFFVGLVLGEFAVGGMWSFVRGVLGVQTYTFFY